MKNRIKVARAEVNITQGELAEKIGVTRQAVNSIELGKYVPSTLLAAKRGSARKKPPREATKPRWWNSPTGAS